MKKRYTYMMLAAMLLSCFGCQTKKQDLAASSQTYPIIIATDSPSDTVTGLFAEKFAQEVIRLSEGKIQMKVYDNGVLGGDRELLESCKNDDIAFVVQSSAPQVNFMPKLAVFDLPVAYTDISSLRKVLDDEDFYSQISDVYKNGGFHLMALADQNFRVMTTNKKISSINDFKGLKIRTMENSNHIAFWKAIGANPTPMTMSEVYIGLQQGTIDAQENPYEVIVSAKVYEQQDYVAETNHVPHLLSLITSNSFYDSLTVEQKQIFDEAALLARNHARKQADKRVENRLKIIEESGTRMLPLTDDLINEIREKSKHVYADIQKQCGNELYNTYLKYGKEKGEILYEYSNN